ncbi:MAG: hypothetical protein J5753_01695, partial [Oscillospiraceae bacterium]|nr:hypothetical protein [Oscillospiraceae bacterium]
LLSCRQPQPIRWIWNIGQPPFNKIIIARFQQKVNAGNCGLCADYCDFTPTDCDDAAASVSEMFDLHIAILSDFHVKSLLFLL